MGVTLFGLQNRHKFYSEMLIQHPEKKELLERKLAETEKLIVECSLKASEYIAKQIEL